MLGFASKAVRGSAYSLALSSPEKRLENHGEKRKCWEGPKSLQGKGRGEEGSRKREEKFFRSQLDWWSK